ncbi:carbohydrate ABC transporter permease [Ktedonospora formicarum]|uniref:Sugar ABC transporter permease n=1 Tax=Ktedonospora formicarum TaxID=2778364 RepID=A0A8J3HY47_9CHLR|nr:carbohydrate ABC transporter permease [Ktedonospora formicarum]GHO42772.1 sugar ABC transporter permease [Ktedonospora formicarum]
MKQYSTPLQRVVTHILLLIGLVVSVFPFYWMFVMSTNTTSDIYRVPPVLIFGNQLLVNVSHVFQNIDFVQNFINTLIVAAVLTALTLFFCSIAGFTFAKFDFPGKNVLFVILLGTLILPSGAAAGSLIGSFEITAGLGWVNTFLPLIVPSMASAFGIFWMRQNALSIPTELIDAARIDGAGHMRLYVTVALPALRPALGFLGILTFITAWNDYLWPLIVLNNPKIYTLQVALASLNGIYNTDYSMVMAGTLLSTIPLIIIFFLGARQFIANLSAGALKF